jgi:hypothetical protein
MKPIPLIKLIGFPIKGVSYIFVSYSSMSLQISFSEQKTGIMTTPAGQRFPGPYLLQRAENMWEALGIARQYLEQHPDHEVWIGSSVDRHRIVPAAPRAFAIWQERYQREQAVGEVRLGMTYGAVVSLLGWPDNCSVQLRRSPMAVILRYQPRDIDFHFDDGGYLWLVLEDDPENPKTILK